MNPRRSPSGASDPHPTPPAARDVPWRRWRGAALALALVLAGGDGAAAESLAAARETFLAAERSLRDGAAVDLAALRGYPLYPYLRHQELTRLPQWPAEEIRAFLQEYADSPLAARLRDGWLRQLAVARRWPEYLRDFIPTRNAELDCWHRQALLATGQGEAALGDFAALWLRGAALPAACDPLIAVWRARGEPTPERLWQRFALAMQNGNQRLAQALRAAMAAPDQALADAWLGVTADPRALLDPDRIALADPRALAILDDGLRRWGKRNAVEAAAALDALKARDPTLAPRLAAVERQLALWVASDYHPSARDRLAALPEAVVDRDVSEWRIRVCLRQGDWTTALRWLDRLPVSERDSLRWKYWRARSLEALGQDQPAKALYRSIADQRDYHGFLAADRLGAPYVIASAPLAPPMRALEELLARSPALRRARELYVLGREPEADAEWRQATRSFDPPALVQAAVLAQHWEWHAQAIATIARAEQWQDLELRFPLAYRDHVSTQARSSAIEPAWVYAVIRQESAFRPEARSPVGALGLMQLMPATGRQIAQELQEPASDEPSLLRPDINIRYGAHYLRRLLNQLQDNPVLATAAYNAGPNKITQWLPAAAAVPADLWAETIPYRETRAYVQRVMEYAAIYQRRLGAVQPEPTLGSQMKPVLPLAASSQG